MVCIISNHPLDEESEDLMQSQEWESEESEEDSEDEEFSYREQPSADSIKKKKELRERRK